jgi:hypothetical protein
MKKARIFVPVQWSKESLEFVNEINEKMEKWAVRKTYFARIRPTVVVKGLCTSGLKLRGRMGGDLRG